MIVRWYSEEESHIYEIEAKSVSFGIKACFIENYRGKYFTVPIFNLLSIRNK